MTTQYSAMTLQFDIDVAALTETWLQAKKTCKAIHRYPKTTEYLKMK